MRKSAQQPPRCLSEKRANDRNLALEEIGAVSLKMGT
jgi:hypothetical protein